MAKVYIEPRPKGRPEGTRIDDYAVEDNSNSVLSSHATQAEAVAWAKARLYSPVMVARVRRTDKGNADHWRAQS